MWREVGHIISNNNLLREGINCWLQYVVGQPVNIDVNIFLFLVLQYCGVITLTKLLKKKDEAIMHLQ